MTNLDNQQQQQQQSDQEQQQSSRSISITTTAGQQRNNNIAERPAITFNLHKLFIPNVEINVFKVCLSLYVSFVSNILSVEFLFFFFPKIKIQTESTD